MAYPAAAALVAAASGQARAALDALDSDQLASLRSAAIVAVEDYCGQSFDTAVTTTEVLDGDGTARLYLPRRLAELTSLTVTGTSLSAAQVTIDASRATLHIVPIDVSNAYLRAMSALDDDMTPARRRFMAGVGNIAIEGVWGWPDEDFPDGVALAMRYDMEEQALADASALSSSIHAFRRLGLRSASQGNLSASLLAGRAGLSDRAQRSLRSLVWHAHGLAA